MTFELLIMLGATNSKTELCLLYHLVVRFNLNRWKIEIFQNKGYLDPNKKGHSYYCSEKNKKKTKKSYGKKYNKCLEEQKLL